MFLFEKKIIYLSWYRNGEKERAAGFIKAVREKDAYNLDIHIRSELKELRGNYIMLLELDGKEIPWEKINIDDGNATEHKQIQVRNEMIYIGREVHREKELHGIRLIINEQNWIAGDFGNKGNVAADGNFGNKKESQKVGIEERKETLNAEISLHAADKKASTKENAGNDFLKTDKVKVENPVFEDKWEQLQQNYQTVHPFDDQRIFLSIEPKDFVVLQAPFQKLVNNSFLLHGFYNYRHLILGPDKELGGEGKIKFYLGVPGTYFEREKMVAIMFGFEGFECAGAVEIGKFGYYMRRVEL